MRGAACCGDDAPRGVSALLALCRRQGGSSLSSGAPAAASIGVSPELLELSVRDMSCVLLEPCKACIQPASSDSCCWIVRELTCAASVSSG